MEPGHEKAWGWHVVMIPVYVFILGAGVYIVFAVCVIIGWVLFICYELIVHCFDGLRWLCTRNEVVGPPALTLSDFKNGKDSITCIQPVSYTYV